MMDAITIQYVVISVLFLGAVFFLIRRIRKSLKGKHGCAKGCGMCNFSEQPQNTPY